MKIKFHNESKDNFYAELKFRVNKLLFEDGLYKVQGSLTGAVLVETVTSKIKGSTRKAYFLKYGTDEYKKVVMSKK